MKRITNQSFTTLLSAASLATLALAFVSFAALEPADVTAQESDSSTVVVSLTVNDEISITNQDGNAIDMGTIGVASDEATGGTSFLVQTNNEAGYQLELESETTPAMQQVEGADAFADYAATDDAPTTWDISDGTGTAQDYAFGYSAYGAAADAKWGEGTDCDQQGGDQGQDIPDADKSYAGFDGDTQQQVGTTDAATAGETTTICFAAAKQGDPEDGSPNAGEYEATVVATATNL